MPASRARSRDSRPRTGWRRRRSRSATPSSISPSPRARWRSPTPVSTIDESNAERVGVVIGSGIGGLPLIERTHSTMLETRTGPGLAVLHPGPDRQSGRRPGVDPDRRARTQQRPCHGLHHRSPCGGRCLPADPARLRRRHDHRRRGGRDHAARGRRIHRHARALPAQRRAAARLPPLGQGPRRLRHGRGRRHPGARGARVGARRAARPSTPRSSATA